MIGIIPAAGAGTRFKELGKQYSKTILPYKEKPILIHQIDWLQNHGCTDIRVVLNHQEDSVKEIINLYNKNVKLYKQKERNGLADAIQCALGDNDSDSVLILLGDLVVEEELDAVVFENNFIAVQTVPDYSRWCMVECTENGLVFHDKPEHRPDTNNAVSGVYYILNSNDLLEKLNTQLADDSNKINGEFQISTVLQWIANESSMSTHNIKLIDFGTLEEYLQNRSVKISRAFNDVKIDGPFVVKSSQKEREKIIKEYNWFMNLPDKIAVRTPKIFSKDLFAQRSWYKMEKILAPSLREIYLFLDNSEETWSDIFDAAFDNLNAMEEYGQHNSFITSVLDKTKDRVKKIEIPIHNKLVNEFIDLLQNNIGRYNRPSLMHGDYCFSNLLYDFQGNQIKMIDPRGDLFGDHYYEVAKLCQSILFDYDFIDAELYVRENGTFKLYNNGKTGIKQVFKNKMNKYYSEDEQKYILLICASLFLSLIPLHSHNPSNQEIYYAIFVDIYRNFLENDFSSTKSIEY